MKGDGDPSCFTKIEDTGIPELQEWCHTLTVSSRERAARNFLIHLKTFANSVRSYVSDNGEITAADRLALREKFESAPQDDEDDEEDGMMYGGGWASSDDPILGGLDPYALAGLPHADLYSMNRPAPKVDTRGEAIGIMPRLTRVRMLKAAAPVLLDLNLLYRNSGKLSTNVSRTYRIVSETD